MKYLKKIDINSIIAGGATILLLFVISIFFDFYYDMNDDLLIHDIISGVYTGSPQGHNIQMLYPLSFLLSIPYQMVRGMNWYGIFLVSMQFVCFYLITNRVLSYIEKKLYKIVAIIPITFFFLAFCYYNLVNVQYTASSGIIIATGTILFLLGRSDVSWKEYLKLNIGNIILILVGFCMREEMGLLMFPFVCVAGLIKWCGEAKIFTKDNICKYLLVFGTLLVSMSACFIINISAYSSTEWKAFLKFFDARTTLYDYGSVPGYDENEDFYVENGITREQVALIENYNFGLDDTIDENIMQLVADKSMEDVATSATLIQRVKKSIVEYKWRTLLFENKPFQTNDFPANFIVIILYVAVFIMAILYKRYRYILLAMILGVVRSGLWLFLIYRMRTPARITMPLYLIESLTLFAMLLYFTKIRLGNSLMVKIVKVAKVAVLCGLLAVSICSVIYIHSDLENIEEKRVKENMAYNEFLRYAQMNSDCFYFIDVYSSIYFSEKIFEKRENSIGNYAIISSWSARSPLEETKYEKYGINDIHSALIEDGNVYLVNETGKSLDWLVNHYFSKDIEIKINEIKQLGNDGLEILKISKEM